MSTEPSDEFDPEQAAAQAAEEAQRKVILESLARSTGRLLVVVAIAILRTVLAAYAFIFLGISWAIMLLAGYYAVVIVNAIWKTRRHLRPAQSPTLTEDEQEMAVRAEQALRAPTYTPRVILRLIPSLVMGIIAGIGVAHLINVPAAIAAVIVFATATAFGPAVYRPTELLLADLIWFNAPNRPNTPEI